MIRLIFTLSLVVCLLTSIGVVHGQLSRFPAPPPLSPPSDNSVLNSAPGATADSHGRGGTPSNENEPSTNAGSATPPTATASTLNSMTALDDETKIGRGDTISFRVIEDRDPAVQLVVSDTGEVNFPYINRVKVEGKTCHEVAIEVKKLLEVDYYKQATVIVGLDLINDFDKTKPKDLAWVMGEVKEVGPQELPKNQPLTVSQIILRSGGFGDFADQRKVKIIHRSDTDVPGKTVDVTNAKNFQVIDVEAIIQGKSSVDPTVRPGDYIIVPKKFLNF
jgi:polysaccharide export outer membrane protein